MSRLNIKGGGGMLGREIQALCINYWIHKLRHGRGTIQYKTVYGTTKSVYGNNLQPAVIRNLEHRLICSTYERKLLVRTPPPPHPPSSAPQWLTGDMHLFAMLIAQMIKKFWTMRETCSSSHCSQQSVTGRCPATIQYSPHSQAHIFRIFSLLNSSFYHVLSKFTLTFP
jgi:hypothetical protein